jgi:CheY-like chemotaxis protein
MDGSILHVDDQSLLTAPIREFISKETGREVLYASSISEALKIVDSTPEGIALILLDVMMASSDIPEIYKQDPRGHSTGLLAVPLLRKRLKKDGAEIWLLTVRGRNIPDQELSKAKIAKNRVYSKPIEDVEAFLNDIRFFLGAVKI